MAEEQTRPNIGVISDCALQRHALQKALEAYGINVSLSCEPTLLKDQLEDRMQKVNCWILELDDEDLESEALDQLIEQEKIPVLFGLGKAPAKQNEQYISWERRLLSKLEEHLGQVEILESEDSILALDLTEHHPEEKLLAASAVTEKIIAEEIWVLAASLGGPAAVKAFLDELPASIKAGFLYAQHVDAHFSTVLTNVLGRHSKLELKAMVQGSVINEGEVLVVPVDNEIEFSSFGVNIKANQWDGPYGPSIDHLLKNVFQKYGVHCHLIDFSGMGNDGALLAPTLKRHGCSIWTQKPETCANGSMPQSIIDIECSEFSESPQALAKALIKRVGCR